MTMELLDRPEEKRLFGLDLKINRYHIINPDKGELMITELRSKGFSWILIFITCCGMGVLICFLGYVSSDTASHILAALFGLFFIYLGCFAVFKQFFSKMVSHFTAHEFIETSTFGRKKIIPREQVRSVFMQETKKYRNGRYEGSEYQVCLRVPGYNRDNQFGVVVISNEDVSKKIRPETLPGGYSGAEADAYNLARLISEHWNIPISV